uniref:SHSP domain-containing protein n=1 Tax=Strongyloides papillosus TaxID=174720 RepID=A0A0N5BHH0_STREA
MSIYSQSLGLRRKEEITTVEIPLALPNNDDERCRIHDVIIREGLEEFISLENSGKLFITCKQPGTEAVSNGNQIPVNPTTLNNYTNPKTGNCSSHSPELCVNNNGTETTPTLSNEGSGESENQDEYLTGTVSGIHVNQNISNISSTQVPTSTISSTSNNHPTEPEGSGGNEPNYDLFNFN